MDKQRTSRKLLAGLLLAAGFVCAPIAQAALEDLGNGVIADTDLGIAWLADANYSQTSGYNTDGLMTWSAANNWVNQLNVGDHSDWRLPNSSEFSHLFSAELDGVKDHNIYDTHNNANFALFSNIQAPHYTNAYTYWTSTPTGDADIHSTFGFNAGRDFTDNKDIGHFAMVVTTIVPEPETYAMLLAGLGLVRYPKKHYIVGEYLPGVGRPLPGYFFDSRANSIAMNGIAITPAHIGAAPYNADLYS